MYSLEVLGRFYESSFTVYLLLKSVSIWRGFAIRDIKNRILMRTILIVFFIHLGFVSSAQSKLNRLYGQVDFGYRHHWSTGITAHYLNHLSTSVSYASTKWQHEEVFYSPTNALFLKKNKLYDTAKKFNLLVGVTTKNLDILDFSVLIGPSIIYHRIFSNVAIEEYYDYDDSKFKERFAYDLEEKMTFGFAARVDLSFAISQLVGLNIGFEGTFNEERNYSRILIGLNLGLVRDREWGQK